MSEQLADGQIAILEALDKPRLAADIAKRSGLAPSGIYTLLQRMVDRGFVERLELGGYSRTKEGGRVLRAAQRFAEQLDRRRTNR